MAPRATDASSHGLFKPSLTPFLGPSCHSIHSLIPRPCDCTSYTCLSCTMAPDGVLHPFESLTRILVPVVPTQSHGDCWALRGCPSLALQLDTSSNHSTSSQPAQYRRTCHRTPGGRERVRRRCAARRRRSAGRRPLRRASRPMQARDPPTWGPCRRGGGHRPSEDRTPPPISFFTRAAAKNAVLKGGVCVAAFIVSAGYNFV